MALIIQMPKLGLTMTEGRIVKWYKAEGETVKKGDILFGVETDKITSELEAEADGILRKIIVNEGDTVPITEPVAILASEDEDIAGLAAAIGSKPSSNIGEIQAEAKTTVKDIKASPIAKRLAKENNIDLSKVIGSGPEGRIVEKDIKDYIEMNDKKVKATPLAVKVANEMGVELNSIIGNGRIMKQDVLNTIPENELRKEQGATGDTKAALSAMRKIIADRMSESWSTSPRVTYNVEIDVTGMINFRDSLKDTCAEENVRLTYNHILMLICSKALKQFPYMNASFANDEIVLHSDINIGIAVALDDGLIVPNVKGIQEKSLLEIARETESKVESARRGMLKPEDVSGGTFTITNLGTYGIESFSPIINQPELAILGVNAIIDKPVAVDKSIEIRPMMGLSLTADHRVIDGAVAARFLAKVRELIQNPCMLLL